MGTLLISKIREEYPDRMMMTFSVVPSPKVRAGAGWLWRLQGCCPNENWEREAGSGSPPLRRMFDAMDRPVKPPPARPKPYAKPGSSFLPDSPLPLSPTPCHPLPFPTTPSRQ